METVCRGVFPDSNRLWKVTQRRFHTAWQELLGDQLQICPTVGRELTHDVVVGNLETRVRWDGRRREAVRGDTHRGRRAQGG